MMTVRDKIRIIVRDAEKRYGIGMAEFILS
jgi:hypothetical protein